MEFLLFEKGKNSPLLTIWKCLYFLNGIILFDIKLECGGNSSGLL